MEKRIKIMELQKVRRLLYIMLKRETTRYNKLGFAPKRDLKIDNINNKIEKIENKLSELGVDICGNSIIPLF